MEAVRAGRWVAWTGRVAPVWTGKALLPVDCGAGNTAGFERGLTMGCAAVDDTDFGQAVTLRFHIAPARIPALTQALADATAGTAAPVWTGEAFFPTDDV